MTRRTESLIPEDVASRDSSDTWPADKDRLDDEYNTAPHGSWFDKHDSAKMGIDPALLSI